jgi:hypothetical protein
MGRKLAREAWWKTWQTHLMKYLESPPRAGIFIHEHFHSIRSVLEIACGSSKDSIYLSKKGFSVVATDFEVRLINYLKNRFYYSNLIYQAADAFKLPFKENAFDLVFHNGLFVCFNNDKDIYALLKEQERVSRKYILFFVHNRQNSELVKSFSKLASHDPLYDIRFFAPKEILEIVENSNIKLKYVKILKFGGPIDFLFSKRIRRVIPNLFYSFVLKLIPKLYQLQSWEKTERIVCIIKLDKK